MFVLEVDSVYFNCQSYRAEMQCCAAESSISRGRAGPDKGQKGRETQRKTTEGEGTGGEEGEKDWQLERDVM